MDMLMHIPKGFSGRATRRPAKIACPARVATPEFGGLPSTSLRTSPDAPGIHGTTRFGPRLAGGLSPGATALLQFGRKLL